MSKFFNHKKIKKLINHYTKIEGKKAWMNIDQFNSNHGGEKNTIKIVA